MPGYGGTNGPDGSKKTGDQGQGTRDANGGNTGGGKSVGNGGGGGPKKDKGLLDKLADLFGGKAAYTNNPNAPKNVPQTGTVASFPNASAGYVAGKFVDTIMGATPAGWANAVFSGVNGMTTGNFDGVATEAAKAFGATRGEQGPDVPGGGAERGGRGAALRTRLAKSPATASRQKDDPTDTLAPDWADGRNPSATQLLLDTIVSQSLNPSRVLLG